MYGNLAIATMLFCSRWAVGPQRWNPRLLRTSFWSLNLGIALMVVLDLFPVGVDQLMVVMSDGYAFGRSQAYLSGNVSQTLTWLRGVGVAVFIFGGVIPLVWFVVSRWSDLKQSEPAGEPFVVPPTVLTVAPGYESADGRVPAAVAARSSIAEVLPAAEPDPAVAHNGKGGA